MHADVELSRRLLVIEKAMTVIFMKFALSGYYQTAFQHARDIMESCSVAPCVKLLKLGCANGRPGSWFPIAATDAITRPHKGARHDMLA
jgi:hypothetical protein